MLDREERDMQGYEPESKPLGLAKDRDSKTCAKIFTHHPPRGPEDVAQHEAIREAGRSLSALIVALCPRCKDREIAIDKVREAVMWANTALALNR